MRPTTVRRLAAAAGLYAATWLVNRSLREVTGDSMRPTLAPGDRVLVVPTWLRAPRRGDVVLAVDPRRPSRTTVKRLAAVPGDRVGEGPVERRLGPDEHLLLGDSPAASTDSRAFGPVAAAALSAVVVWRVRPWGRVPSRQSLRARPGGG